MPAKRLSFHCPTCDSEDVIINADVSWNKEEQRWEVEDTYDAAYCNTCEDEMRYLVRRETEEGTTNG